MLKRVAFPLALLVLPSHLVAEEPGRAGRYAARPASSPTSGPFRRPTATPYLPWRPTPLPPPTASPLPALPSPRPTATPRPTGTVRVTVLITGPDGRPAPASDAVVWLPGVPAPAGAAAPAALRMSSREKRFEPRVLAVPKGSTVTFPNFDKIFHNVFSLSEASQFDLGLYRNGASKTASFETPGVVRVYCNIHPQMAAYVVVLDGSRYAQTGKDGVALFPDVPAGRQTLKVWEERGGEWSGTVAVPTGGTAEVAVPLNASKWKDQPHKNKHGKEYPPPDDDENRY